jgi:dihydrofolate reductase/3',5'-cyclic AMP phosphodiesterase CpdA
MADPWILHISDPHLGDVSPGQTLDDEKQVLESQPDLETTQTVFKRTLKALGRFVKDNGKPEVVVVSGDLAYQAHSSGFAAFKALLRERADILPEKRSQIVVVPGNHDVVWDEAPGTLPRYKGFLGATRAQRCVTPLLDGIDFDAETGELFDVASRHPHVASTAHVLAVALNTSNDCGVLAAPRRAMSEEQWRTALEPLGREREQLMKELRRLRQHDMPRISRAQIQALGAYFESMGLPRRAEDDPRLRVAVLHHQLLPVSTREERKPFESLVNLGEVRAMLQDYGFELVLHGHKHESGMYWDIATEGELTAPVRRILVISSPGHFDVNDPTMRAIMLTGPATARNARIITFKGAGPHRQQAVRDDGELVPLWLGDDQPPRGQTLISAPTTHLAYARLRALFELRDGEQLQNLVCRIEHPSDAGAAPPDLPMVSADDPQAWLSGLVDWWQRERSELVSRGLLPFNHGERIYRRWGDQVERAIEMLNARDDSSRALVALVAPGETGRYPGPGIGAEIMGAGKFGPPGWPDDPDWQGWWGPNPPFHTPTFVLTHHPRPSIEMEGGTTFHFLDAAPAEALDAARQAADGQDIRIGGGPTVVRDFLAAGLVDHMHLVQVPTVLGRGVRVWDGLEALEEDYEVEAVSAPSGVTHLTFDRKTS